MRNVILVWSRRSGKSLLSWFLLVREALTDPGVYWFCFDEFRTAERNIWSAVTSSGMKFMDVIPKNMIVSTNSAKLKIELTNGSIIQLIGINNADNLVGAGLKGVVFDEYALLNPTSIDLITPMLAETGGWQVAISTPRGDNHFKTEYDYAVKHPDVWYSSRVHCGMPEIAKYYAPGFLEEARRKVIAKYGNDAIFQQEYMTSFISPNSGSVFGDLMRIAKEEGRIKPIYANPDWPCYTAWDLGSSDSTSIVLFQVAEDGGFRLLDHIENNRQSAEWYADEIRRKEWEVAYHFLPHDGGHHRGAKNETYKQVLAEYGIRNTVVLKRPHRVSDKLNFLRRLFFKSEINDACERVIECLEKLEYEWNDSKKIWSDKPTHNNGYSDTVDSVCYLAQAILSFRLAGNKSPAFLPGVISNGNTSQKTQSKEEFLESVAKNIFNRDQPNIKSPKLPF